MINTKLQKFQMQSYGDFDKEVSAKSSFKPSLQE